MMPFIKLKVAAVTTSQPPQSSTAERVRLVRGVRRVSQRTYVISTSAAGSSQAT